MSINASASLSPGLTIGAAAAPASSIANELAKATFRRLARMRLEPTPENYTRAYAQEAGTFTEDNANPAPATAAETETVARVAAAAWAAVTERLLLNLERAGKQWTAARRKDSLRRVFDGSRSNPARLQQRLQSLLKAWEDDLPAQGLELVEGHDTAAETAPSALSELPVAVRQAAPAWPDVVTALTDTVTTALVAPQGGAAALAQRLQEVARALAIDGASAAHVAQVEMLCQQARLWLGQRHHLVRELSRLCRELSGGMAELVEDGSWVQGSCTAVVACLNGGAEHDDNEPSLRAVRSASALLADARQRQQGVRGERLAAQQALKSMIQNMLLEVGDLGEHTGRFQLATTAHAKAISEAPSLESLAGVVQSLLADSRAVQAAVQQSSSRLHADRDRAAELEGKVLELESELRRLSDEVSTDALTKVANRRGLAQIFESECARVLREGRAGLAVGLIDIDNFKKLNDTLGHVAGDLALQNLAEQVQGRLRPTDHLARFGGEEFVVLMPGTAADEAQQALTRLQRSLTEALFLHEGREVFVTFSGGVTQWQPGESLEMALSRADTAMYEAKRSGKNRTCSA